MENQAEMQAILNELNAAREALEGSGEECESQVDIVKLRAQVDALQGRMELLGSKRAQDETEFYKGVEKVYHDLSAGVEALMAAKDEHEKKLAMMESRLEVHEQSKLMEGDSLSISADPRESVSSDLKNPDNVLATSPESALLPEVTDSPQREQHGSACYSVQDQAQQTPVLQADAENDKRIYATIAASTRASVETDIFIREIKSELVERNNRLAKSTQKRREKEIYGARDDGILGQSCSPFASQSDGGLSLEAYQATRESDQTNLFIETVTKGMNERIERIVATSSPSTSNVARKLDFQVDSPAIGSQTPLSLYSETRHLPTLLSSLRLQNLNKE